MNPALRHRSPTGLELVLTQPWASRRWLLAEPGDETVVNFRENRQRAGVVCGRSNNDSSGAARARRELLLVFRPGRP
jgi:hypothetical protein